MSNQPNHGRRKSSESNKEEEERARSPSVLSQSSVTSGALEWDHTADIGKYKESTAKDGSATSGIGDLSTIERMAINKSSDLVNKSSNPNTERQRGVYKNQGPSSKRPSSFFRNNEITDNKARADEVVADRSEDLNSEVRDNSSDDESKTMEDNETRKPTPSTTKPQMKTTENKRWSSVDYSILEKGAFGFFNIGAKKAQAGKRKEDNIAEGEISDDASKLGSTTNSGSRSGSRQRNVLQDSSTKSPKENVDDQRDTEITQYSDANKSETGESQFADADDSPFEDKNSPQFTDAHESAIEDTSNSEFVDANDSATGGHTTSEFTDAHESIDVQYTDSDRSRRTDFDSGEDKISTEYQLHSSPTYTLLNNENRSRSKTKQPSESEKPDTISSSEVSDPLTSRDQRPSSSSRLPSAAEPSTSSALLRQHESGITYRTSSPIQRARLYNIQDSQTEPGDTSDENQPGIKNRKGRGRGVSDASTDWEYGNENSKSDPTSQSKSREGPSTHSDNGSMTHNDPMTGRSSVSRGTSYQSGVERSQSSLSASEWQTSGLTRSELEYKLKQTNSSTSTGTSSVMWLEILANQENDLSGDPKLLKLKNRGVQTQATVPKKVNKRSGPGVDVTESSSTSLVVDDSNRNDSSRKSPNRREESHRVRREKNPRIRLEENPRIRRGDNRTGPEEKPLVATTSSSELSPACKLIEKIIKTSPKKPNKLLKVIDEHKDYHATKVEKDLRHLQRLVKIIHGSGTSPPSSSNGSTSTDDETDSSYIRKYIHEYNKEKGASHRRHYNDDDSNFKRPSVPYSKRTNKRSDQCKSSPPFDEDIKDPRIVKAATKYQGVNSVKKGVSDRRTHPKYNMVSTKHRKPIEMSSQTQIHSHKENLNKHKIDPQTAVLHERIDLLSSKFDTLADLLILSQEITLKKELEKKNKKMQLEKEEKVSGRHMKAEKVQKGRETVKHPPKPPVCFFIPFPNSRGSPYGQRNMTKEDCPQRDERRNLNESPIFDENVDDERKCSEDENDSENDSDDGEKENCFPSSNDRNCKSLQDAFERYHKEFICRTREREAILTKLKLERELRAEMKRDWVRKYGECPSDASQTLDKCLPPKGPRVMSHKEMRQLTAKNYKRALEVQEKNLQRKQEQEKKTNRLMSQLFARKLRQKALKGDVNILHSTSLVRK